MNISLGYKKPKENAMWKLCIISNFTAEKNIYMKTCYFSFINLYHLTASLEGGASGFTCVDISSSKCTVHMTNTKKYFFIASGKILKIIQTMTHV